MVIISVFKSAHHYKFLLKMSQKSIYTASFQWNFLWMILCLCIQVEKEMTSEKKEKVRWNFSILTCIVFYCTTWKQLFLFVCKTKTACQMNCCTRSVLQIFQNLGILECLVEMNQLSIVCEISQFYSSMVLCSQTFNLQRIPNKYQNKVLKNDT